MSDRGYRILNAFLWTFLLIWALGGPIAIVCFFRAGTVDYGALLAAEVFQQVMREPVPRGVSDLRIAGHGFMQGHEVWIRFRATGNALREVLPEADEPGDRLSWRESFPIDFGRLIHEADPRAVGWEEAVWIRRPRLNNFSRAWGGQGWFGFFILDRESHTVYLWAQVL